MQCPACGHENNSLATRCAACGAPLTLNEQNDTSTDATIPTEAQSPEGTAERPVTADAPEPAAEQAPQLRDVAGAAGKLAASKRQQIGQFFQKHQRALGICLALLVVGVLGTVWLVINVFDAPSYTQIESDMSKTLQSYDYAGGTYGPDLQVPLSSIAVTERSATKTPEGLEVSGGVGPTAFNVEAEATFDDGKIHAVRNVGATYVHGDGSWQMSGDLAERGLSLTARSGVDEEKVLANMSSVLDAASTSSGAPLADIYANGSFSIVGNVFKEAGGKDTATNDVTVHCQKESGFYSYQGNVIAHFAFESGTWTLRSAEADSNVGTRTYDPIVGTWTGVLISTSGNGGKCFGAQNHAFEVTIESVGDASDERSQVQGTVTALAHYHDRLERNKEETAGDELLERVSFTGSVRASQDEGLGDGLSIACTTAGNSLGGLDFVLYFGNDDDSSAVTAIVTSTYTYEETVLFFIPHQTTAQFVDEYALTRQ